MRVNRALEKLRKFFTQTRRDTFGGDHCRSGFGQLRSRRAGGAGQNNFRRRDGQRRGGGRFNLNLRQRSIENYGMDKSENSDRQRRGRVACRGNHHRHRQGNSAIIGPIRGMSPGQHLL